MEPNYIALIALCVVISTEAKLFIGDCSYGFCEQKCKQLKEFEMECFCKRGFALKTDGRKCIKSFYTDDEQSSGDDASGEVGNCDNEDGNCDKTQTEVIYSGDGDDDEEGSGALTTITKKPGLVKPTDKVIPTNISSVLHVETVESTSKVVIVKPIEETIKIPVKPTTTRIVSTPTRVDGKYFVTKTPIVKIIHTKKRPVLKESSSTTKQILTPVKIFPVLETITSSSPKILPTKVKVHPVLETTSSSSKILPVSVKIHPVLETTSSSSKILPVSVKIHPVLEATSSSSSKKLPTRVKIHPVLETTSSSPKKLPTSVKIHPVLETTSSSPKKLPTSIKIQPVLETTSSSSPKKLLTNVLALITTQIQLHKKDITVTSVKTMVSIAKSKDIIGRFKSPIVISQKSVSINKFQSFSTPAYKYLPSSTSATSSTVKVSDVLDVSRKILKSVKNTSSIYEHIPIKVPMVSKTIRLKQPYTTSVNNVSPSIHVPTVVYSTTGFVEIKKFVIQDDEEVPSDPYEYKRKEYSQSDIIGLPTRPDVTIVMPDKRFPDVIMSKIKVPVMPSIDIHKNIVPVNATVVKPDIEIPAIQTKTIKYVDKPLLVYSDVTKSSSKSLRIPLLKSTVYKMNTSIAHSTNVSDGKVHKLRKTIKGSISSSLPKSSFHIVSTPTGIIKKTAPLGTVSSRIILPSRLIDAPLRKSTFTDNIVDKTGIDLKEKDLISSSSTKSDDVKRTEIKSYKKPTSSPSKIISSSSVGVGKPEQSDKVTVIQSSPTKRVIETKRVIVISDKSSQSHECTLLVNTSLLTSVTFLAIYFLSVY